MHARNVRFAALSVLLTLAMMAGVPAANAADVSVLKMTSPGQAIARGERLAVFAINMTGSGTFESVRVQIAGVGADDDFDVATDLEASPEGIAVYRDNSDPDVDVLDSGDTRVSSGFAANNGDWIVTVSSAPIPANAEGSATFFLAVQASDQIGDGDDFTVTIPAAGLIGACAFTTNPATNPLFSDCGSGTTDTIRASIAPTAELLSSPGSPDGNIVWQFSENVVGVNDQNVVVRNALNQTLQATVTYSPGTLTATLDPAQPLAPGKTYKTIVNPGVVPDEDRVKDSDGNTVATTEETFTLPQFGFTPGVVRGSTWYLSNDFDGDHDVTAFAYGGSGDRRLAGDWNGDGVTTVGVRRGNAWYLSDNLTGSQTVPTFAFGNSTDVPVMGDWDGDGDWTPGVIRGNTWYLSNDFDGDHDIAPFRYGNPTDSFVVGDWDDDTKMTPGVVRGNRWYLSNLFTGAQTVPAFTYGASSDRKLVGDWDGDGKTTPAVIRGNVWYLNNNFDGTHNISPFALGASSDVAIAGDWDSSIQP